MELTQIEAKIIGDERGALVSLEQLSEVIPFDIKRVYYIFGTQEKVRRGFHAHINLRQVAFCVNGSCRILLDNGIDRQEVLLDHPAKGLLIEQMIWREMYDFSSDCVLLVIASELYDESDYIRKYDQFSELINKSGV